MNRRLEFDSSEFCSKIRQINAELTSARTGAELGNLLGRAKLDAHAKMREAGHSETVSQVLALKIINSILARIEFTARRIKAVCRPFGLELDPCNACALACPGCVHSRKELFDWPKGMLSPDRMDAFLRRYGPYAVQVMFYNYGEPLLNPRTPEYIRLAKLYLAQTMISTSLSTTRFDADAYVASGLDYMLLSIDGATQPVYERFRKNGDIKTVFHNIEKLVAARDRAGSKFPALAWQFLAFEHNRQEIPAAIKIATDLGVNEMRIMQPFDVSWDDPTLLPAADFLGQGLELHPVTPDDYRRNWNRFPDDLAVDSIQQAFDGAWPNIDDGPLAPPAPGHTCQWLYMNTVMDATGRILPCACAPAPRQNLVFGQLDPDNSAPDLFNTPLHQSARAHFATGHQSAAGPHCQNCEWLDAQHKADIDPSHLGQYFSAIHPPILDSATGSWLSDWKS
jgi:MoaA/NifB/PqqE/SkfB family radical SAM enzyme